MNKKEQFESLTLKACIWTIIAYSLIKLKHQHINQTKSLDANIKEVAGCYHLFLILFYGTYILFKPHTRQFDDLNDFNSLLFTMILWFYSNKDHQFN